MTEHTEVPPQVFFWFALWGGICVACIYLAQPLLHALGRAFLVPDAQVSLVTTFTQVGYGVGIFTLVPLGDFFDRKRLILVKLALLSLATLGCALAPGFPALLASSFVMGALATTAQDLVPVAADLAPDEKRGQYIGQVMMGLMLGILLSRTVSGLIADHFGWRAVFLFGFAGTLLSFVSCWLRFPALEPRTRAGSILSIYTSMASLFKAHAPLRLALLRHGLMGMAFSGFWTRLSFYLSGEAYGWTSSSIGLMGLGGAAGALSTSLVGRLSDRKGPLYSIRIATVLAFVSFLAMGVIAPNVFVLIAGVVLFDLAVQSSLVSHQAIIYGLDPTARGRLNGIFVSGLFAFFSLGSFLSALTWSHFGWSGLMTFCCVCALGARLLAGRGA